MKWDELNERVKAACRNSHIRTHGMTLDEYRKAYALARTVNLWPPELRAKQR